MPRPIKAAPSPKRRTQAEIAAIQDQYFADAYKMDQAIMLADIDRGGYTVVNETPRPGDPIIGEGYSDLKISEYLAHHCAGMDEFVRDDWVEDWATYTPPIHLTSEQSFDNDQGCLRNDLRWYLTLPLGNGDYSPPMNFCPFCGDRIEPHLAASLLYRLEHTDEGT